MDLAKEFDFDDESRVLDIYEVNYQDMMSSWLQPDDKRNAQEELIKREYSASKIFNQGSSDSLHVENQMIRKIKPQH